MGLSSTVSTGSVLRLPLESFFSFFPDFLDFLDSTFGDSEGTTLGDGDRLLSSLETSLGSGERLLLLLSPEKGPLMKMENVFSPQTNVHVLALENASFYDVAVLYLKLENDDAPPEHDLLLMKEDVVICRASFSDEKLLWVELVSVVFLQSDDPFLAMEIFSYSYETDP